MVAGVVLGEHQPFAGLIRETQVKLGRGANQHDSPPMQDKAVQNNIAYNVYRATLYSAKFIDGYCFVTAY